MKRITRLFLLMVVFIPLTFSASGQRDGFSGTWRIDRAKSVIPDYTPVLTQVTVKLSADSINTKRFYDIGDGQEYPFDEKLPLNGTNVSITIYDMPRKANAKIGRAHV